LQQADPKDDDDGVVAIKRNTVFAFWLFQ